jgi:RNA polymerase-binding protein DksA
MVAIHAAEKGFAGAAPSRPIFQVHERCLKRSPCSPVCCQIAGTVCASGISVQSVENVDKDLRMPNLSKLKAELELRLKELNDRRLEIEQELSSTANPDWEEEAKESEDDEVLLEIGDVSEKEIRDIKLALHRIESGQYGICADCGNAIPKERLAALPFATTCIRCA